MLITPLRHYAIDAITPLHYAIIITHLMMMPLIHYWLITPLR
jgi:hypothetical protein